MNVWPEFVLVVVFGVLAVAAVLFLALWLLARRSQRGLERDRAATEALREDRLRTSEEHAARARAAYETITVAVQQVNGIAKTAESGRFASEAEPQAAVRALGGIADAAQATLADLRRAADLVGGHGEPDPALEVVDREQLFDGMRSAGLQVIVVESGEPFALAPGAEVAVLRILHEALSNALEFGGEGTEATVTLVWTEDTLQLKIDDDGVRATARRAGLDPDDTAHRPDDREHLETLVGASGAGVTRMRTRAELLGGVFKASPVPGVGFSVAVVFPSLRYHNGIHSVDLADTRARSV